MTLVLEDESGFSFSPNCPGTWGEVGHAPILLETPGRHNHTGIGFITRTPNRHFLKFHDGFAVKYLSAIFKGSARTEDFIFLLTGLHHFYGHKVVIVWDNLSAHHAADAYFEDNHPDWFEFEYFPPYSPELNPTEPCWNQMKNVYLPFFVPATDDELTQAVCEAAEKINEEQLLDSFFQHAGLSP